MRNKFLLTCATLVLTLLWGGVSINELRAQTSTDVTATYVTNPGFETDDASADLKTGWTTPTGWTLTPNSPSNSQAGIGNSSSTIQGIGSTFSPSAGDKYFYVRCNWQTNNTITLSQELALPVGDYSISFQAATYDNTATAPTYVVTATDGTTTETVNLSRNAKTWGKYTICVHKTTDEGTTLTVSFAMTQKSQEGSQHVQMLLDDFRVFKYEKSFVTPYEAGDYYIYNVDKQQYLVGANAWGTQASVGKEGIKTAATLNNGGYTISTANVYAGKNLGSNGYVDGSAAKWCLFENGVGSYYIMSNGQFLTAEAEGTACIMSDAVPADNKGQWKFVTKDEIIANAKATGTKSNPVELTALMTNPNFSRVADKKGWTTTSSGGDFKTAGDNGNFNLQQWNGTFSVTQSVTDLPNGLYKVTAQGFYRPGANTAETAVQKSFISANDVNQALIYIWEGGKASQDNEGGWDAENTTSGSSVYVPNSQANVSKVFSASEDNYLNTLTDVIVKDGTLTVTIKKTETVSNDWTIIDNVRFYYLGADNRALAAEITAAEALYGEGTGLNASDLRTAIDKAIAVRDNANATQDDTDAALAALMAAEDTYRSCQATLDAPVDFTTAIGDADFSTNTGKWSAYSVQYGVNENYNKAFDIKQTITLPAAGVYALGVQAFYRNAWSENAYTAHFNGTENKAQIYAGDNTVNVKSVMADALVSDDIATGSRSNVNGFYFPNDRNCANAYFEAGKYQNYLVFTADAAGEITIGIKSASTTAGNWSSFDNFTLKYYGQAATEAQVTAKVLAGTQRQSISEAKREAATATAYNTAVSTWEAVDASTMTATDIRSANEDVTEKALLAEVSAIAYTSLNTAIAEAEAYAAATDYAGKEAYNTAISTAETAYNNGTYTAAEVTEAVATLAAAKKTYVLSQTQSFDTPADYTYFIVNPSFEANTIDPWTRDQWGQTGVYAATHDTYKFSGSDGNYIFVMQNNDGQEHTYSVWQSITIPATGWYSLSAVVAGGEGSPYISLNGSQVSQACTDAAVGVTLTTDKVYLEKDATVEVKAGSNKPFRVDNFQLAYYGDGVKVDMAITEAQWATFVAPFEVAVPSGVTASKIDSETGGILKLTSVGAAIPANTPVVLNSDAVVNETFYGVAEAGTPKVGLLTGVYTNTTAETGWYVLQNNDGKVGFYLVDTGVATPTVGANRAYLTVPKGASAPRFFLFDDATGINTIAKQAENAQGIIYDMQGRRVNNVTSHGIYIINGKKIVK